MAIKKDKHVLPGMDDTLSQRVKNGWKKKGTGQKTIFGPNNEPLVSVDMEAAQELDLGKNRK